MMKKIFLSVLLAVLAFLPYAGSAHEIKTTGTLEILLHRDPEDDPIAREPAQLYFSVTDKAEKFTFPDCECQVTIKLGGEVLVDRLLTPEDEAPDWGVNVSRVDYTFPRRGLYVVTLQGSSKADYYPDFRLDYDVRVDRESATAPVQQAADEADNSLRNYYIIGGAVIISGIIVYELFSKLRKRNK